MDFLGSAAFSKAVQALDIKTGMLVCLKIVKVRPDAPHTVTQHVLFSCLSCSSKALLCTAACRSGLAHRIMGSVWSMCA